MRALHLLAVVILVALAAYVAHAAVGGYSLWLTAHPQAIVADSHSSTTITAELRDSSGHAVPDGTMVDFTTSLGVIERRVRTAGGVARARLESGSVTGTALVSAVASEGNAVAQLRVDFLEPGTEMFDESFVVVDSKKFLGYDSDARLVDSAGGVTITHRGLVITAEEAQISLKTNILRAKAKMGSDDIVIKRGGKQLAASWLFYDLNAMRGVIITPASDGAKRMLFRGRDLFTEQDQDPKDTVKFDFDPVTDAQMFIRCRSMIIRPGEEIKFKRASYYIDGQKLLSVPLQVLKLRDGSGGMGQFLTYGTDGLRLDVPFYYSLTPSGTGAVRLKHSEPTGWGSYSDRAGWQVDVDQEYNIGSTEGKVNLNRVTSKDWGVTWDQRNEFADSSQLYSYLNFPSHRNLYGTMDYTRPLGNYTFSTSLRADKLQNRTGRYAASSYLQSRARPLISDAVSYGFTTRFSYDSASSGSSMGTGLGLQLYGKPIRFGANTSLTTSVNASQNWGGSNRGATVYANAGLYRALGTFGSLGLNYSYSWANTLYGYSAQQISADLSLRPAGRWNAGLYTTYGLSDHSVSAFGNLGYTFMRDWRMEFDNTYQRMQYLTYSDFELSLCRALGRQQARLTWSQSRKRLKLEFTAGSF